MDRHVMGAHQQSRFSKKDAQASALRVVQNQMSRNYFSLNLGVR